MPTSMAHVQKPTTGSGERKIAKDCTANEASVGSHPCMLRATV